MSDIFISYFSKDREKAEQIIELLSSAGLGTPEYEEVKGMVEALEAEPRLRV
jgi:hypothetical protein